MKRRPHPVPGETVRQQARAADPRNSVWVSANAGAGKTHVLSERVIRLLLEGTDPARILCLTYTRAAAANMSSRVFSRLSEWTSLGDKELERRIADLEGRRPSAEKLARARKLFAEALDTPGGLKIQTIHAFCESVLQQFPIEANVAGHFTLLDRRMESLLMAEARREMLTLAAPAELAEAFATVLERGGEFGLDTLLAEIMPKREAVRELISGLSAGGAFIRAQLFAEFGFASEENAEAIAASVWPLPGFPRPVFEAFVAAAEHVDARRVLNQMLPDAKLGFAETDPVKRLKLLACGFLRDGGARYDASAFKQALQARMPDLLERYECAATALIAACDRLALFRMVEGTAAALAIADWLMVRYEQLKSARGLLDFNDLITRTVRLLSRHDAAAWVQYKLDQGIDHILLDEAQDTSPAQWHVVTRLAEEFFAGRGARDGVRRTIFAVGDEKQSIYSFQGAVPEAFAETGIAFGKKIRDAKAAFEQVRLTLSFRSTNDVLRAVDSVFSTPDARRGITQDPSPVRHEAIRFDAPGYVEVWPSVAAGEVEEPEDWTLAVDHARAPAVLVAETVAATIQHWLKTHEVIEGTGRRLAPADVMVLVRKRDRFVHALSRSLKEKGIPVAGADRLALPDHIAVKDLVALGRFVLQQDDDLSLAAVLRSPIFGLEEETLFELAARRPAGTSLISVLRNRMGSRPDLADVVERLDDWSTQAAFRPVFEFYARVLAGSPDAEGVRRKMIARLGHEAGDILDEFLSFCLAEERSGLPGLEAFLATLESAGPEIKREMDQGRDEVRIMTVHAAKGLEAPVVFLVDGGTAPAIEQHLPRLLPFETRNIPWRGTGFLWRSSADVSNSFSRAAADRLRERADDEYRRLLYVGMTRAEDRLIICGYHGKRSRHPATWHAIVAGALSGLAETSERPHPVTGEPVQRFRVTPVPALQPELGLVEPRLKHPPLPADFFRSPLPEEDLPEPLTPSGASLLVEQPAASSASGRSPVLEDDRAAGSAAARGVIIHKLLQMLPATPSDVRESSALRYLGRAAAEWPDEERRAVWEQVRQILESPQFAPLFGAGSRAEVAVMGELPVRGRPRLISGVIDRLAVAGDAVLILDYKSNRPPPAALSEVPSAYVTQLALYAALLRQLYPGRRISAALLFTEAPRLMTLPEAALADALARLTHA